MPVFVFLRVDQKELPYDESGHREWYVLAIECTPYDEAAGEHSSSQDSQTIYFTMIVFEPGSYTMGPPRTNYGNYDSELVHEVEINRRFAVSDRKLAWRQLDAKDSGVLRGMWSKQFSRDIHDTEPVFGFSWPDSIDYCFWLSAQAGMSFEQFSYADPDLKEGEWPIRLDRPGFRQLTEQEWEYVCRSGTRTPYSFGHDMRWLSEYGWFRESSDDWSHPVAMPRPNPRGIFDIHGNVYEWCYDWFGEEYSDGPTGPPNGDTRVYRGGCFYIEDWCCASSHRNSGELDKRGAGLGFRIVQTLP